MLKEPNFVLLCCDRVYDTSSCEDLTDTHPTVPDVFRRR